MNHDASLPRYQLACEKRCANNPRCSSTDPYCAECYDTIMRLHQPRLRARPLIIPRRPSAPSSAAASASRASRSLSDSDADSDWDFATDSDLDLDLDLDLDTDLDGDAVRNERDGRQNNTKGAACADLRISDHHQHNQHQHQHQDSHQHQHQHQHQHHQHNDSQHQTQTQTADMTKQDVRCAACARRVGWLPFACRCGAVLCVLHRYAEEHACPFDYKTQARNLLLRENPPILPTKIQIL